MSDNDEIKTAREGVALVGDIIKAAGDNPNVKEAGEHLGKSALTITKTINNILLPLAAVNFAFDKARRYFDEQFQKDLSKKTADIPEKNIVEPKASIAGPVLQGLAFSHEEQNLKDMYINLLSKSMDKDNAEKAHPSFVEIIRQLTSKEAYILNAFLSSSEPQPVSQVRLNIKNDNAWNLLIKYLINTVSVSAEPVEDSIKPSMIENYIRLGLIEVDYSKSLKSEDRYDWVEDRPEVIQLKKQYEDEDHKITFTKGIIARTSFGYEFYKAVVI